MKLLKTIPFSCDDTSYEVRILLDNTIINIVVFQGSHPATQYRHHVLIPKTADPAKIIETDAFDETVALARQDIEEKRWERLRAVL